MTGKCLDVTDGNTWNGASIQLWPCNGGVSEEWWHSYNTSFSFVSLVDYRSKKCLDVPNASVIEIDVWQWTCNGTVAQQFYMP